jgi:hypothetical protein
LRHRNYRLRGDSRTLPVRSEPNYTESNGVDDQGDTGKLYRCWNCGFICNADRDELGDEDTKAAISFQIYDQVYSSDNNNTTDGSTRQIGDIIHGHNSGVPLLQMLVIRTGHAIHQADAAGDNVAVQVNWEPDITGGCPFCGSRNWRGDY